MNCGSLMSVPHRSQALWHTLESSRWGEGAFAIRQWGAVWNLWKSSFPPMPVGRGSVDKRKPASDTQHLPLAPWCKQHANPPLTCISWGVKFCMYSPSPLLCGCAWQSVYYKSVKEVHLKSMMKFTGNQKARGGWDIECCSAGFPVVHG